MGKGIDLARKENPELAELLDEMKDQLIIVLVNRLGSDIEIPIKEIDGTGDFLLTMELNQKRQSFNFKCHKKN